MNKIYVINKTLANLLFKNGYITIPRGGFAAVSAGDINSSEFIMAHERGWIETSTEAPTAVTIEPIQTVSVQSPVQGMTAAELADDLAKDKPDVPRATSEALGAETANGTEPKPCIVTALGQEEVVDAAVETETARRGRKPKTEKAAD